MSETLQFPSNSAQGHMHWLASAVISLALLSAGAYVLGRNSEKPAVSFGLCSLGFLLFGLILTLYDWILLSKSLGKVAGVKESGMYKDGEIAPGVWIALLGGLFLFIGQISLLLGYNLDPASRGIVSIIVIGTCLAGVLLHYLVYNEKPTLIQLLGMIGTTGGLAIICLQSTYEGKVTAFLCGLGAVIGYCLKNFTARVCDLRQLDVDITGILGSYGMGAAGMISLLGFYLAGETNFTVADEHIALMNVIGGFLMAYGSFFITQAIMTGPVGPSVIIGNCFGVTQVWLEYFFHGVVPDTLKIIGSAMIIGFTAFMLMGDTVVEKCRSPPENEPLKERLLPTSA